MSFQDHIDHCNDGAATEAVPFFAGETALGRVTPTRAAMMIDTWSCFTAANDGGVAFRADIQTPEQRTEAIGGVIDELVRMDEVTGFRGELYPARNKWGETPHFLFERAASAWFGLRSYGVHMNGYVRNSDGSMSIWIAERAHDKPSYPGMLDNMVAGGQPYNFSLFDNLVKECQEEADIPAGLASRAVATGCLTYIHLGSNGIKPDCMYNYDLELPADFTPRNTDGEVEQFVLMPAEDVVEIVRNTKRFKFNCNLSLLDFFIRHGLLTPDGEPDYVALCQRLRS